MKSSTERVVDATRLVKQMVPSPWNRHEFLKSVGDYRNRPVHLTRVASTALRNLPCGLWVALEDRDEIIYDASTSDYHVDQTILHEVGHMMLDHRGGGTMYGGLAALLPDIDLAALKFVMARSNFDEEQESEAELFADLVMSSTVSRFRRSGAMHDFWDRS